MWILRKQAGTWLNQAIALGTNKYRPAQGGAESFFLPSPRTLDAVEAGDFAAHRADWGWPADAWARDAPIVPQEPTFASSAILRSIFTSHLTSLGPSKFSSIRVICSKRRSLLLPRSVSMCPRCDAGVPPASYCVVGSRGPPFSVTQLISNPPSQRTHARGHVILKTLAFLVLPYLFRAGLP